MSLDPSTKRSAKQARLADETHHGGPARSELPVVQRQIRDFMLQADLAEVLNASSEVICILNSDRQVVFVNDEAVKVFGMNARKDMIGRRIGEVIDCVHVGETSGGCGTSPSCDHCALTKAILSSLDGNVADEECYIVRHGRREPMDLRIRSAAVHIAGGTFLVVTIQDVSDQKRRRALERAIFHDILDAVGSLSGYAELLIHARGRDIDEFRATIQSLADQMLEEVYAQRGLIMAERGELIPVKRQLMTDHILRSTVRRFERMAEAQGKVIRIAPMEEQFVISSDEVLLRRVLGSMIKNAIEATRAGSAVMVGCTVIGSRARFWVHNPEIMLREVQLQVFKRSFSTKGSDRGLGTYSMKLLVERYLGGQVSFESSSERGTIFCADIPLSPAVN